MLQTACAHQAPVHLSYLLCGQRVSRRARTCTLTPPFTPWLPPGPRLTWRVGEGICSQASPQPHTSSPVTFWPRNALRLRGPHVLRSLGAWAIGWNTGLPHTPSGLASQSHRKQPGNNPHHHHPPASTTPSGSSQQALRTPARLEGWLVLICSGISPEHGHHSELLQEWHLPQPPHREPVPGPGLP